METFGIPRVALDRILTTVIGLEPETILDSDDASLAELGVDSIGVIELGKVLAEQYRVELPDTAAALSIEGVRQTVNSALGAIEGRTDHSIYLDAPLELVWRMTNDVRSWPDLFTEYASIEVLHQHGNTVRFRLTMVPDDDGTVWSWVSERTSDLRTWTSSAHRVETGPFQYMRIYWSFERENAGTRMRWRQEFAAKSEAPFDDAAITNRINKNSTIQMAAIKTKIEHVAAGDAVTVGPRPS